MTENLPTSDEIRDEIAEEGPEKALEETPADMTEETPADMADETPADMADETPADMADETPADMADETPADVAEETPADIVEETPADVAEETPAVEPKGSKSKKKAKQKVGQAEDPDADTMPLMEHLRELRTRLFRSAIALLITTSISFAFARFVLMFLIAPMGDTIPQALKPTESLGNYMKVALMCGLTLAMPVIVYQIGRFLAPGLTKRERRWLFVLVPGATLCFVTGVAFAYYVMMPTAIPFLQGFMADIVEQQWALGEYLSFVISLMLWIGIAFELPLFVFFLAKLGIIDAQMLRRNRKYAIVLIAIASAVITPTVDPVNMALVMGPLVILYELGVLLAKLA